MKAKELFSGKAVLQKQTETRATGKRAAGRRGRIKRERRGGGGGGGE